MNELKTVNGEFGREAKLACDVRELEVEIKKELVKSPVRTELNWFISSRPSDTLQLRFYLNVFVLVSILP